MSPNPNSAKSVLITGCSSGIGRAIALYLAKNGFTVFASVRKEKDAEQLRQLRDPNLIPVCPLDLTCLGDIPPVMETIQAELQRRGQAGLYALINNAGNGMVSPLEMMDVDAFQNVLQTRLVGPLALVQACLPLLRQGGGRILWIMTPAIIPIKYVASIHACDFAANCLARTLDLELAEWDIPVIQIRCGGIETDSAPMSGSFIESVLQHPRGGLYRQAMQKWGMGISNFDRKRTPPEKVGEVIMTALEARIPRRYYAVGHMAGTAALLELLPQPMVDKILRSRS
jgi:NAD(P)-dependent dehydrogenase (short-subunit alcohol dehydrogenase family)